MGGEGTGGICPGAPRWSGAILEKWSMVNDQGKSFQKNVNSGAMVKLCLKAQMMCVLKIQDRPINFFLKSVSESACPNGFQ